VTLQQAPRIKIVFLNGFQCSRCCDNLTQFKQHFYLRSDGRHGTDIIRWIAASLANEIFTLTLLPNSMFGWMVPVWLREGSQMKSLTTGQKLQLVEIITEEFGNELVIEEFTDALLGLLEDVAGFETAKQEAIVKLTQQLWRNYNERI
jgi:hypothetical protein